MTALSFVMLCLRVLVAAVFIAYAASKLHNPSSFAAVIRSHRLIPDSLSSFAAWTLIGVEMAVGLLFLFNVFPLLTGIAIGVLLLLFSGVLLRARFTNQLNVRSCGCSGVIDQKATIGRALLRNAVLLCMLVPIVITVIVSRSISSSSSLLIEVAILVLVLAGVVCSQTRLLSPILHSLQAKTTHNQGEESSVLAVRSNRRSFLKWGVQLGVATLIGVGALWSGTLDVFAHYPCPNNEPCDCGPGGKGPWSGSSSCSETWDCIGHAGQYVPVTEVCIVYCCGSGQECDVLDYQSGEIYCPEGC
jgi:uncharacterized membrane protein YphA (DoxX/SURF4 family)